MGLISQTKTLKGELSKQQNNPGGERKAVGKEAMLLATGTTVPKLSGSADATNHLASS